MRYDMKQGGARIRHLRRQCGYTQERLAGALNIDRSLLSHIEAGKRVCSVDLLIQLADFFDVSLDFLILGKERNSFSENYRKLLKTAIAELINLLEAFSRNL